MKSCKIKRNVTDVTTSSYGHDQKSMSHWYLCILRVSNRMNPKKFLIRSLGKSTRRTLSTFL